MNHNNNPSPIRYVNVDSFIRSLWKFSCTVLIIGLLSSHNVRSQNSITVGSGTGYPGITVTLPISQAFEPNSAVAAQFDILFDTNRVTAEEIVRGNLPAAYFFRAREISPGVLRAVVYSLDNRSIPNLRQVGRIPFRISPREHVSSGPIIPENSVWALLSAEPIDPILSEAGFIQIRPINARPNGIVDFFFGSEPSIEYSIEATTNFIHWIGLTNLTAQEDFMDLVDPDAPLFPQRFYRWRR